MVIERTDRTTECWLWTGHIDQKGYGRVSTGKRNSLKYAHRVSWEEANGRPVPDGMCVLHACDTPACIRPDHLWIGTKRENNLDRVAKGRSAKEVPSRQGELNWAAKLSDADAREIRSMLGNTTQRHIASMYGVSQSVISNIATGRRKR